MSLHCYWALLPFSRLAWSLVPGRTILVSLLFDCRMIGPLYAYTLTEGRAGSVFINATVLNFTIWDTWIAGGDLNNIKLALVLVDGALRIFSIANLLVVRRGLGIVFFLRLEVQIIGVRTLLVSFSSFHRQRNRLLECLRWFCVHFWIARLGELAALCQTLRF